MNYQTFAVFDLVNDDIFLKHQLSPNVFSEAFWQNWLQQYPEKQQGGCCSICKDLVLSIVLVTL
jgi:hypothetical protein